MSRRCSGEGTESWGGGVTNAPSQAFVCSALMRCPYLWAFCYSLALSDNPPPSTMVMNKDPALPKPYVEGEQGTLPRPEPGCAVPGSSNASTEETCILGVGATPRTSKMPPGGPLKSPHPLSRLTGSGGFALVLQVDCGKQRLLG